MLNFQLHTLKFEKKAQNPKKVNKLKPLSYIPSGVLVLSTGSKHFK